MINTIDSVLLKYYIMRKGISQKELASQLNITYPTFSRKITGAIEFRLSEVQFIAKYLNLTDEAIISIFFAHEFTKT